MKQKSINKSHQKKDNKCFHFTATLGLNYEKKKTEKAPERIRKIKPFIVKQTGIIEKRINFLSEKDDSKTFEEKKIKIAFNVLYVKNWTYVMPSFENITQIVKTTYFFNDSKKQKSNSIQFYCKTPIVQ